MADAPGASVTLDASGIDPDAAAQSSAGAQVQVPPVAPAGSGSDTGAAATADGPAFVTTTV